MRIVADVVVYGNRIMKENLTNLFLKQIKKVEGSKTLKQRKVESSKTLKHKREGNQKRKSFDEVYRCHSEGRSFIRQTADRLSFRDVMSFDRQSVRERFRRRSGNNRTENFDFRDFIGAATTTRHMCYSLQETRTKKQGPSKSPIKQEIPRNDENVAATCDAVTKQEFRKHRSLSELERFGSMGLRRLKQLNNIPQKLSEYKLHIPQKLSELKNERERKNQILDYGTCQHIVEMKPWTTTVERLTNISHSSVYKRSVSASETITENARDFLNKSFRKYGSRKGSFSSSVSSESDVISIKCDVVGEMVPCTGTPRDLRLTREIFQNSFLAENCAGFSTNVWYFGEINVKQCTGNINCELDSESIDSVSCTMLARVDRFGDVTYDLTSLSRDKNNDDVIKNMSVPFKNGRFCLDFGDWMQPRFASVKFLIASLIEVQKLQRVSFDWLIEYSMQCNNVNIFDEDRGSFDDTLPNNLTTSSLDAKSVSFTSLDAEKVFSNLDDFLQDQLFETSTEQE